MLELEASESSGTGSLSEAAKGGSVEELLGCGGTSFELEGSSIRSRFVGGESGFERSVGLTERSGG